MIDIRTTRLVDVVWRPGGAGVVRGDQQRCNESVIEGDITSCDQVRAGTVWCQESYVKIKQRSNSCCHSSTIGKRA